MSKMKIEVFIAGENRALVLIDVIGEAWQQDGEWLADFEAFYKDGEPAILSTPQIDDVMFELIEQHKGQVDEWQRDLANEQAAEWRYGL